MIISPFRAIIPLGHRGGAINWATRTPSALVLTALSPTSIRAAWANAGTGFDGHSVEISTDGVNFTEEDTVLFGTNTLDITGLTSGTLYYVRVRAYKGVEYSPYCDIVSEETIYLPTDIANGYFRWAADAIVGLNNADPVTTWEDGFASNNDLAQTTAGSKPTYRTNQINGLPIVQGDGTADWMRKLTVTSTQPITVYAVIQPQAGSASKIFLAFDGISLSTVLATGKMRFSAYAGASLQTGDTIDWGLTAIGSFVINGASSAIYTNGGFEKTGNVGAGNGGRLHICSDTAATAFSDAFLAELIGYTGAHDATTRRRLEEYLSWKWAVELEPI